MISKDTKKKLLKIGEWASQMSPGDAVSGRDLQLLKKLVSGIVEAEGASTEEKEKEKKGKKKERGFFDSFFGDDDDEGEEEEDEDEDD
jgi:hypothetical protein